MPQLNQYNNVFGYHTPEESLKAFNKLKELCPDIDFIDSSWHNEPCDSVEFGKDDQNNYQYCLYFPNIWDASKPTNLDEEDFTNFTIEINGEHLDFATVESLAVALKKLKL